MLTEEKILELLEEYGGDREIILLIEDKLNILEIPQDEEFLELLEEIYSYYMSSELISEQSCGYNKISVEEAITFLFNNKYLKDYEDFDSISHGSSYKN